MSPIRMTGRIAAATFLLFAGVARAADERAWTVSKSSGEVWTVTAGAQPVSLSQQADLQPGDAVRTGRNGRVLLVRGEESILIAPNSAIGIPKKSADGMSTTIVQQAGSILLEVEKRNVQHFEVETPYLAAVVKGTQFRVSVGATGTSVNVLRGQVQVADFKSGQIAQVMPGQSATSFAQGKIGLALSGSGSFSPIEQGKPRAPAIERLMVPKNGLTAPRNAAAGTQIRTVGQITPAASATTARTAVAAKPSAMPSVMPARPAGGIRIAAPIGDVRLNFGKVTNGLARGTTAPTSGRAVASRDSTIWTSRDGKPSSSVAPGNSSDPASPNGSTNVAATSPGVAAAATPAAAVVSSDGGSAASGSSAASSGLSNSNSGSNGNSSNSGSSNNGRGNAATGNGNGTQVGENSGRGNNGNGNGNNGNGNGNNGNGNGKGNNGNGNNGNNGNGNSGNGNNGNGNGNGNGRNH
jgi:hypothetical protein